MINIYKNNFKTKKLEKIKKYGIGTWVNIVDPDTKELEKIIRDLKLDKDNVIDGLDINETPRIEQENGKLYIYLRTPTKMISQQSTSSFLIIITKENFITISRQNLEIFSLINSGKISFITKQKSRNLMKLLYLVSRQFDNSVRRIYKEVKSDKKHMTKLSNRDVLDLVLQEDVLNDYNYSFDPMINIYAKVLKIRQVKFTEKDRGFIEDLIIDLNQTAKTNLLTLKTITNMRSYYSTTVSNKLNDLITILTLFTVFITIPTMISGIYGMNIALPFQQHPQIIAILGGIVLLIWGIFFMIVKKKKII